MKKTVFDLFREIEDRERTYKPKKEELDEIINAIESLYNLHKTVTGKYPDYLIVNPKVEQYIKKLNNHWRAYYGLPPEEPFVKSNGEVAKMIMCFYFDTTLLVKTDGNEPFLRFADSAIRGCAE